ncbi:MAG TPA: T9SS type A sorting domain-containing protein, partial [Candidatus Kapabacteria bacterium]|nr:T9SS type A sorting domain-containing protein [Candidatus Kapabacteria bacterium]
FRAGDLLFARNNNSLLSTDLQGEWQLALADIASLNELALMPSGRLLAGLNDRGLFELLPVSAVELHQASKPADLKIYPNPAGKSVTIETDAASIEVYNSLGQFVASIERPVGSTVTFAVSDLTPGVYSLKAMTSEGVRTTRLIVTR